jgi:hypothetical protein
VEESERWKTGKIIIRLERLQLADDNLWGPPMIILLLFFFLYSQPIKMAPSEIDQ